MSKIADFLDHLFASTYIILQVISKNNTFWQNYFIRGGKIHEASAGKSSTLPKGFLRLPFGTGSASGQDKKRSDRSFFSFLKDSRDDARREEGRDQKDPSGWLT